MALFDVCGAENDSGSASIHGASSGVRFVLTPAPLGTESPLSSPSFSLAQSPRLIDVSLRPDDKFRSSQPHCDLRQLKLVEDDEALLNSKSQRRVKRCGQLSASEAFHLDMQKRSEAAKAKTRGLRQTGCRKQVRAFTRLESRPVTRMQVRSQSVTLAKPTRTLIGRLIQVTLETETKKRDLSEESGMKQLDRDFKNTWTSLRLGPSLSHRQSLETLLACLSGAGYAVEAMGHSLWTALTSHHTFIPRQRVLQAIKARLTHTHKAQQPSTRRGAELHRHTLSTPLMSLPQGSRQVGSRAVVKMQEALRNFIDVPRVTLVRST